ncbi:hypothetical protein P4H27_07455 [Paenibacillus taichungensis]|uniref:hypothetical protein n=1 Tax=Paenibacillus taichungensis TaxID=484184 RepID=UPI002DB79B4E|nr:hypothetical protein [Paenibacillus taichungensis]MEC0106773.1 hypothetical protein [Paenibacillus taichungensis]MEC0195297.1 hypothetical protein [Paenibacillus taichungensis]
MGKKIIFLILLSLVLTACGSNVSEPASNNESRIETPVTTAKVEVEQSLCNNGDVQDQVFCLLKLKKYAEAEELLASNEIEDKVTSLLNTYISCMKESAFTDECSEALTSLSDLRSSEKIGSTRAGSLVILLADKISEDAKRTATNAVEEFNSKHFQPEIGMTEEKVLESTWGKPQKINKTKNKYGVSEQWVYGSGRYVYLDDGIVTSIQE